MWFIVQVGAAKPPIPVLLVEWQDSQAIVVAMWYAGLATTPVNCPPWQVAHPAVMPAWLMIAPRKLVVFEWQESQETAGIEVSPTLIWVVGSVAPVSVCLVLSL